MSTFSYKVINMQILTSSIDVPTWTYHLVHLNCSCKNIELQMSKGYDALFTSQILNLDCAFRECLGLHVYCLVLAKGIKETKENIQERHHAFENIHNKVINKEGFSIKGYSVDCRKEHFNNAFLNWRSQMKPSLPTREKPRMEHTIWRIFYWLLLSPMVRPFMWHNELQ